MIIDAPQIQISEPALAMQVLLTSSDRADLTIMNTGTEDLLLRTGSSNMALLGPDNSTLAWVTATAVTSGALPVQVGGTDDRPVTLQTNETLVLSMEFFGTRVGSVAGTYNGRLQIASNDPATPVAQLPLAITVNDYGLIMIGLPETVVAAVTPASVSEYSQTVYSVHSSDLPWSVVDCSCGLNDALYPCQRIPSGTPDEMLVELDSCGGTIAVGGSYPFRIRLTAPRVAGRYQESWVLAVPASVSLSFLRGFADMVVTPALDQLQASATTIARLVRPGDSNGPIRASQQFSLVCTMYDTYGNEIQSDGLSGWSVVVDTASNTTVEAAIAFDFSLRSDGRAGLYVTDAIEAERKGIYAVSTVSEAGGGEVSLAGGFSVAVEPLVCDPPRVLSSADGASCIVQWCDTGNEVSSDRLSCQACDEGMYSSDGRLCTPAATGRLQRCPAAGHVHTARLAV